jgi:SAM-dependent methyltransferase
VSLAASPPSRLAAQTRVAPEERPPLADEEPGRPTERPAPTAYLGRTVAPPMHYSGAGWLTRASREQEEHPRRLLTALAIQPGQTLCDFGCGNGYHTLPLARRTGPRGMVFAVDIQPEMLELLRERASLRGVENIRPVLADPAAPELPAGKFDLILMVDVYHEIADPPPVLAAVREALAPTGRLALVEFREEDPEVPILPLHKMSQNQVHQELTANDFKLVEVVNSLPWQHLMCYARSDSPLPAVELAPWQPAASEPGQEAAPGDPVSEPEQETQIIAR